MELANLQDSKAAGERIFKRFPEFFPESLNDPDNSEQLRDWLLQVYGSGITRYILKADTIGIPPMYRREEIPGRLFIYWLSDIFLRSVWGCLDLRQAEWMIFGTRLFFRVPADRGTPLLQTLIEPPQITPFEVAMLYLLENIHRTRRCQNAGCQVIPYFFSTKRGQRYCSDTCAGNAQKQIQRRWWATKGKEQRDQKRKERKK